MFVALNERLVSIDEKEWLGLPTSICKGGYLCMRKESEWVSRAWIDEKVS